MERKQKNWSSLLGWAIFVLVIAGGPILGAIQNMLGVRLPSYTLGILIALLMLASAGASIMRAMRSGRSSPEEPSDRQPNTAMPSFGDGGAMIPGVGPRPTPYPPPLASPPPAVTPPASPPTPGALRPPGFEPVVNPLLILLGLVGLAGLAALGLWAFGVLP